MGKLASYGVSMGPTEIFSKIKECLTNEASQQMNVTMSNLQNNAQQFASQQIPTQQIPTQQFPTQQFLNQQFPTQQFPTQQFPTQQYYQMPVQAPTHIDPLPTPVSAPKPSQVPIMTK